MKSITVHNLEDPLANKLLEISRDEGISQNKLIKKLLREALGLEKKKKNKIDLSAIAGTWTEEEAREFEENTKVFNEIDLEGW